VIVDAARAVRVEHEIVLRGGLNLKRFGSELIGSCPRCGGVDRFAVSIAKQGFLCRGCNAAGDVIAFVQPVDGVDFRTAVRTLAGFDNTRPEMGGRKSKTPKIDPRPIELATQSVVNAQNTKWALKVWNDATAISGTLGERYLHGRGLRDLPAGDDVLRFHSCCLYGKARAPCLISLYRDIATDEPRAISRTALDAAGGKVGRMSLGPIGGAAVKLDDYTDVELGLVVGEGLETCLAARQLGFRPVWSLGSPNAIRNFEVLGGVEALTVLVDNDPPKNGRQAGPDAALECSERWRAAGVEVTRIVPRATGADMADLIQQGRIRHAG
jgi:putative DNA primase/helicase